MALQDHLLDAFTPAAYQDPLGDYPGRRHRQWDPAQAQHWLGCIAWHLDRLGTHDLAVWQLGTTIPAHPRAHRRGRQRPGVRTRGLAERRRPCNRIPLRADLRTHQRACVRASRRSVLRAGLAEGTLACTDPISRGRVPLPSPTNGGVRCRCRLRPRRRARARRHSPVRPRMRAGPRITRLAAQADLSSPPRPVQGMCQPRPDGHPRVRACGRARLRDGRWTHRRVRG